ncbi:MAG: MBL fold metallo-hydrolase, partial [Planctomycetales bacterium]
MATEVTWLGHGTYLLESNGHTILLDPFLTDCPTASAKAEDVSADFILVSHGHGDHVADLVPIAQRTGSKNIAIFEICSWLDKQGVSNNHAMNIGGGHDFPFGRVKMTQAIHSSVLP